MRKLAIFFIIILLTCGAAAVVWSLTTATVTSPTVINIVSSNEALLALEPGDPAKYADYCFIDSSGLLHLDFTETGFSPDSSFEWDQIFWVVNNTTDSINFTIENINEEIKYITIKPFNSNNQLIHDGENMGIFYPLASGERTAINVSFNIPPGSAEQITGTLRIKAEANP